MSRVITERIPLETISIVSDEPHIPWELMIPGEEQTAPLGVTYAVGRWTTRSGAAAPQIVPMIGCSAIAPIYTEPLVHAQDEAELVVRLFHPGAQIKPTTFDNIETQLQGDITGLIHFACHGSVDEHGTGSIHLDDTNRLTDMELRGAAFKKAFREKQPFIFLNACEIGQPAPALNGIGGFAPTFVGLRAAGVIAPIWSVVSSVAYDVATAFYNRVIKEPNTPFAEILRDIKARAYLKDPVDHPKKAATLKDLDSYVAYAYYGDPLASRESLRQPRSTNPRVRVV